MNEDQLTPEQYDRPVAYDAEGRPLYAHPAPVAVQPQVVHIARATEPVKQEISPSTKLKHDASKRYFPSLNLSEGEYVISAVRRHPIGLFIPFTLGVMLMAVSLSALFNYDLVVQMFDLTGAAANTSNVALPILLFNILVAIGTYVAYFVYTSNRFYLTNESVIEEIQTSLFARLEQTVSLGNIEDASYQQKGFIQQFFDYGSIRLSTEGDETTYAFNYVAHPKEQIAALNNAVEAFKNGRPVNDSDN